MDKNISRRDFLRMASITLSGAALAACAPEATLAPPTPAEGVTAGAPALRNVKLTFGFYGTEGFNDTVQGPLLKTLQANLKAKYPTLDFEPITVDYTKQAIAMAAGNAADVSVTNVPAAWPLMYRGQLVNLTEAMSADAEWQEYMTHFVRSTTGAYTYKEALWAVPFSVETTGTIYNEDLLTAAGVKLPHEYGEAEWTWDAFVESAAAMTSGEGPDKKWGSAMSAEWQSGLGDLVVANGGDLLSADGVTARVTEPAFVDAAQRCVDMVLKDKVSPSGGALSTNQLNIYSAFINQKTALMVSGDWAFGWVLNNQLPEAKFKLNFFTSPVSASGNEAAGIGHSTAYYAWAGSKNLPEALALTKFLASIEGQLPITEHWTNSPILSPRTDAQQPFWDLNLVPNPDAMKRAFEVATVYPHTPLMSASIAIGHANTALTLVQDGEETRPLMDVLTEVNDKINTDLAKGASG